MPSVYFTGEPIVSLFGSQRALPSCSRLSSAFVAQPDDAHCLRPIRARAYSLIETLKQKFRLSATARDRTLLLSFCVLLLFKFCKFCMGYFQKEKKSRCLFLTVCPVRYTNKTSDSYSIDPLSFLFFIVSQMRLMLEKASGQTSGIYHMAFAALDRRITSVLSKGPSTLSTGYAKLKGLVAKYTALPDPSAEKKPSMCTVS